MNQRDHSHDAPDPSSDGDLDPIDMSARDHAADDHLTAVLGQALQLSDPVPEHVLAAAQGAYSWRTIDEELADLVFDSNRELTGVRDRSSSRQLTFRSRGCEIEIMLVDAAERRLVGQLVPAQSTKVTLVGTNEQFEQTSDQHGRFSFERVQVGPVRLSVAASAGAPDVTTDWVLL